MPLSSTASRSSVVCTLFDSHYHYGVGALVNSLHAAGFRGSLYAGYRGELPPWAMGRCKPDSHGLSSMTAGEVEIVFVPVETRMNLAYYKPYFIQHIWQGHAEDAERLFFFDADIMTVARWSFFEGWADAGVAVVADGNTPMPVNHPVRVAWRRYFEPHGFRFARRNDYHYNSGFIGLHREQRPLVDAWHRVLTIIAESVSLELPIGLAGAPPECCNRTFPFYLPDQDALNIVTDLEGVVVAPMGSEGMGWKSPAVFMLHACMPNKPWSGDYLRRARRGHSPGDIDDAYWRYTQSPLELFPAAHAARIRKQMKLARIFAPLFGWLQMFRR